jgi:hypothetical protein
VFDLLVELDVAADEVEFVNCSGAVEECNRVRIDYIKPYGFVALNVKKKG